MTPPAPRRTTPWPLHLLGALLLATGLGGAMAADRPAADTPDAVLPDGGRYHGPLQDGLLHGQGRLLWDGDRRYEGGFRRGQMQGQGHYVGTGYTYDGQFVDGTMQGQGKLVRDDGTTYEGEFVQGRMEGLGTLRFGGGYVYEGRFVQNKPSGRGRLLEPSGLAIEGRFDGGYQPVGDATLTTPGGERYEGALQGRTPHGTGTLTLADGTALSGEFRLGELAGRARIRYPGGDVYEGEVDDNQAHGQGELRYANGDVYRGRFAQGEPDGQGRLEKAATARPKRPASVLEGQWRAGEYLGPEGDGTIDDTPGLAARNNEAALYKQQALLQGQFDALLPGSPGGPPQMYALFVAGDGSQEVFRREVAFVDDQFAQRFGTRGRSVRLVNSRSSAERLPLATPHSIGLALQALAQKMDRERDLLFVFLTSHGSKTHELVLGMNRMALPWLPAARLGALLKGSGIRNQVIVVSACYSGGFVPALQGERTWVITAARADRSSFGCADGNDFTYFGRALFKESLPGAATLSVAVERATRQVQAWEARDGVKKTPTGGKAQPSPGDAEAEAARHSEPQSVVAPAFRAEVDAWFKAHAPPKR